MDQILFRIKVIQKLNRTILDEYESYSSMDERNRKVFEQTSRSHRHELTEIVRT